MGQGNDPILSRNGRRPASGLWLRKVFGLAALLAALAASGVAVCAQDPGTSAPTRPEPREGQWMKLHEEFVDRARQGGVDLLFLGDSITRGWDNRSPGGPRGIWERFYAPRRPANFGIGGDRTQHVLWRLDHGELDGISPKVVVLMIGTNNINADTPAEITEGVAAVVKKIREKTPEAKVLLLAVFPRRPNPDAVRDRVKAVNDRIAKLDDGKTVKYLDIGPRFVKDDGTISREVMPDFLHLSRKGYRIWAEAMEPTLWSMLEGG
jgi:lysophospholipase L1-like esterase